ncbi:type IV pilus assembly protein PilE [Natronospira proteinivora]|uniref:Type IV pilus assembly protein PilE n=1 Tax=Natronospira proteinivora TaxID=1807133 RepID=A0ABT1G4Q8_9GAMM|nr:type IV pilin protein [Natronospira proteinivora]MCP1726275.1 type IV pilus assembly protein PilE [Natronospira proteinivora]
MMRQQQAGFTLIEVAIVVLILGIISALAYNGYQSQADQSRRSDAHRTLTDIAQRLERCYTHQNDYQECVNDGDDTTWDSAEGHYEISLSELNRSSFTLVATPQGFHADRDANRCSTLTLSHTGRRDSTGSLEREDCWGL